MADGKLPEPGLARRYWQGLSDQRNATHSERLEQMLLLEAGPLTEWERNFIKSMRSNYRPSPKQLEVFWRIRNKYLKDSP